jgi:hypothetical protein
MSFSPTSSPISLHLNALPPQCLVRGVRRNVARPVLIALLFPAHRLCESSSLSSSLLFRNHACVTTFDAQLPPEIEYKDTGYVARVVVFALMCFGCFISLLLWIGEASHRSPPSSLPAIFVRIDPCSSGPRTKCCANPSERRRRRYPNNSPCASLISEVPVA